MPAYPTLSTDAVEHPAVDYAFLRKEGIEHLERLAGQVWTDFNTHDPGITILEQVCYAITDLEHRINYAIPDLLARDGESTYAGLYGPAQVLTSAPVTLNDLRRLVIDVEGVKNAWVEKIEPTLIYDASQKTLSLPSDSEGRNPAGEPISLKGLYRVLVELSDLYYLDDSIATPESRRAVLANVADRLYANRGLCEDFEYPVALEPQTIQVFARIEIGLVEDTVGLLVEIYRRIAEYISPSIPFFTLGELLQMGKSVDEIFDGPLLDHGFADTHALEQTRRTTFNASDLINVIMDVPGVRVVKVLSISKDRGKRSWFANLDPERAAKFELEQSQISLERNQVVLGDAITTQARDAYLAALRATAKAPHPKSSLPGLPSGRDRHVGAYYSVQHQFPATYGIGAVGLPDSATAERKAQAKQLQAYLLFFDQLLANYFAQLAHVRDLFSFSVNDATTYFSQAVDDDTLGLEDVRREALPEHQVTLQGITDPAAISASPNVRYQRRNRFLNHLLARFAEQFTDYSLMLYSLMPEETERSAAEKLVDDKQAFLMGYPQLSSARGTGFNYLKPLSAENSSGLEKRLRRKLGLDDRDGPCFYVVEHILLRPMEGDEKQLIPILTHLQNKDPYSLQLSFVFPADSPPFHDAEVRAFVERTIREETPAHLVPYVCWFTRETMEAFETAYHEWLAARRSYLTGA